MKQAEIGANYFMVP